MHKNTDTPGSIIFVDVETGGLDPNRHGLLSIGLVYWNDGLICDNKIIFVDPEDKLIDDSAISVNGINMQKHILIALKKDKVIKEFSDFVAKCSEKPLLGGHNTPFDAQFLNTYGIELRDYFQYGFVDTKSIARAMIHAGILRNESTSLVSLCKHFGIDIENPHEALSDAIATAKLYNSLLKTMSNR
ncbi:exonuclease domain-containing protein [Deinococcus sp. A31D244]|uniref:3'-5' exonuclease n=1 Tax=Deinococcus sp. A31D244 TaxID=3397675 RepID=UPI0039E17532